MNFIDWFGSIKQEQTNRKTHVTLTAIYILTVVIYNFFYIKIILYHCFNLSSIKLSEKENASLALQFSPERAATR